jgi:PII-like signaling protein
VKLEGEGRLLRIFVGELDQVDGRPLYEALVLKAREIGMAGATVLRGIEGFGADSRIIHTAKLLRLSEDLPIVIELVDTEEKIERFVKLTSELLEQAGSGGMITDERAHIIHYRQGI